MAGDFQTITAGNATGRMQEIDMSCPVGFRMKRALYCERADMTPAHQARSAITMPEPKLKLCTPTIRLQGNTPVLLRLPRNMTVFLYAALHIGGILTPHENTLKTRGKILMAGQCRARIIDLWVREASCCNAGFQLKLF
jgi:hypothetical protein